MGTIEYWMTLREMRLMKHFHIARPAFIMAILASVTGVILFFAIVAKMF
jgi:hypothetical protein